MNKFKELRKGKKKSQKELGKLVSLTSNAISQYEHCKRKPNTITMQALARALDVDYETVLHCFYGKPQQEIEI